MNTNILLTSVGAIVLASEVALISIAAATTVTFTPPPNQQAPQHASVGSTRRTNLCHAKASSTASITPLTPKQNYGTTLSERPTILVYLPATGEQEAFFSLKDENGDTHYQTTLPITGEEGIVAAKLPDQSPALEIGKTYHWYFALKCDGKLNPSSPVLDGWIERVNVDQTILRSPEPNNLLATAAAYGAAGIWYDTLATLAHLRQARPHDTAIAANWETLLRSVGLETITSAPLLERP